MQLASLGRHLTRRAAALTLAALLVLACGESPQLPRLPPDGVILAFGDSLTFGTGAPAGAAYPAQLERAIARKVVALGVPGELSGSGLARLTRALDEVRPQLLLLCHGGNDLIRRLDEAQVASNVRAMVRLARERGIGVVLIGVPRPGLRLATAGFYGEVARAEGVAYEGDVLTAILSDSSLKADLAHPNERGYAKLALAVAALLRKSGAI